MFLFCVIVKPKLSFVCCLAGFSLQLQVQQFPSDVLGKPDGNIELYCKHRLKDHRVMLWYLQTAGDKALKLIGYGYGQFSNDSVEQSFRKHFKLTGVLSGDEKNGLLAIVDPKPLQHTGTYFCAAREAHCIKHPSVLNKNLLLWPLLILPLNVGQRATLHHHHPTADMRQSLHFVVLPVCQHIAFIHHQNQ